MPKMYDELASWWPLLSAPEDYAEEAGFYGRPAGAGVRRSSAHRARARQRRRQQRLASQDRASAWSLVEPSAGMLEVSRALNPECEHVEGDMRTVRLGRQFDCGLRARRRLLHDHRGRSPAGRSRPRSSIAAPVAPRSSRPITCARHFRPSTDHGGHDDETRGLRYLRVDLGSRSGGLHLPGRVRVSCCAHPTVPSRRARSARRRPLRRARLASFPVGRRLRRAIRAVRSLGARAWDVRAVRRSAAVGGAEGSTA